MAGYLIHIIVAEEYIRKFGVENKKEFIQGTIYPDSVEIKGTTHYSKLYSRETDLCEFLADRKLDTPYNLGYFLHLVADALFYNKYFSLPIGEETRKIVHSEYDILNKNLQEKFNPEIPEEVKEFVKYSDGKLKILDENKIYEFIKEASSYNLYELRDKILKEGNFRKVLGIDK